MPYSPTSPAYNAGPGYSPSRAFDSPIAPHGGDAPYSPTWSNGETKDYDPDDPMADDVPVTQQPVTQQRNYEDTLMRARSFNASSSSEEDAMDDD